MNTQLGNRIKSIRLSLGETMEEFGARFNTSKGTVNNWEKGRNLPNKKSLLIIANLVNLTVEEFLGTDIETSYENFFNSRWQFLEEKNGNYTDLENMDHFPILDYDSWQIIKNYRDAVKILYDNEINPRFYSEEIALDTFTTALNSIHSLFVDEYDLSIFMSLISRLDDIEKIYPIIKSEDKPILEKSANKLINLINLLNYKDNKFKIVVLDNKLHHKKI